MQSIVADDAMKAKLAQANTLVEVRDAKGTVIGFFAPVSLEHAARYAQAAASTQPLSHNRGSKDGSSRTTGEVLDHLKTLEQP
jgi:hypothetical protein